MEKIKDIKKLPSYEEAERLLHFLEDGSHSDYSRNRWLGFCKDQGLYNVYNTEFVDALAREIKRLKDSPIVEICAGRGELSYQLKKRGIDIKPTDDYSGRLSKEGLVERLSHKRALEKYKPRVVLAAWIPHQVIRFDVLDYPTVRYFIDIGESTWMPCGICDKWDRIYLENLDEYSICRLDYIGAVSYTHLTLPTKA
mgnify:CR=1 FL=1